MALLVGAVVSVLVLGVPSAEAVAPDTTAVVLPSNGATLSSGQWLDATASPGATSVIFMLSGGSFSDTVIATATPTIYGWLGGLGHHDRSQRDLHPPERRHLFPVV